MGILENVNSVVAGVKKVRDVAQKIHDADLQSAIADLVMNAADLKLEMANLRDENLELRGKIQEIEKKADIRTKVVYGINGYYLSTPIQGYAQGPFCALCLDADGMLITMTDSGDTGLGHYCPRCARLPRG